MKTQLCAVTLMGVLVGGMAGAETVTIPLEKGECWWGGTVGGGWQMPLDATSVYEKDLRVNSDGNQAAPLLLSTKGRWVWCEEAFRYTVSNGVLTVETGPAPRRQGETPHPMDVFDAAEQSAGATPRPISTAAAAIPNVARTCYAKRTFAPIQQGRAAGGSLRAAFEHCSKTFFPPKGSPKREFFEKVMVDTWVEFNYNQNEKDILAYVDSFFNNGVELGVVQIDCFWQTDAFGPWVFHGARFRDPKGLVDKLHAKGSKVTLWMAPFVTMDTMTYRYLRANEGLLKDARALKPKLTQGLPIAWWDGLSAVFDPTSPNGCAWYRETLARVMRDYGTDGFFFDGGGPNEYPPGDYAAFEPTAQPTDLVRKFIAFACEVPYAKTREAWKLGGMPVVCTLRDKAPKWSEMRRCVTDMIAAGQLGYPFVVADLIGGGTCGNSGAGVFGLNWQDELFIRHLQIQCLSPIVQFSGSPWRVLSPASQEIVKQMLTLRKKFVPYILTQVENCGRTGLPMVRSMDFQYPGKGYERVLDQFMMGEDLLVAPVVEGGAKTRTVVLPAGMWRADDGEVHTGPKTVTVSTPLSRLPHFVRVN